MGAGEEEDGFTEKVKVSLREVGDQLLRIHQDSTSRVLPVVETTPFTFSLSFEEVLSMDPTELVSAVQHSFEKTRLPENYLVEVMQCADREVAYSYSQSKQEEKTVIPCKGRTLPLGCYTVEVHFAKAEISLWNKPLLKFGSLFLIVLLGVAVVGYPPKKKNVIVTEQDSNFEPIGSFQFYPEQHKLVKAAQEISLSRKECELLALFIARPNEIIRRDELTKKVWEDNGVIVGRSLDTYISKLRKKLSDDSRIKLTNVHGVGYKLEIEASI